MRPEARVYAVLTDYFGSNLRGEQQTLHYRLSSIVTEATLRAEAAEAKLQEWSDWEAMLHTELERAVGGKGTCDSLVATLRQRVEELSISAQAGQIREAALSQRVEAEVARLNRCLEGAEDGMLIRENALKHAEAMLEIAESAMKNLAMKLSAAEAEVAQLREAGQRFDGLVAQRIKELEAEVERLRDYMTPAQIEEHGTAMKEWQRANRAEAKLARVVTLHREDVGNRCMECGYSYPCRTACALLTAAKEEEVSVASVFGEAADRQDDLAAAKEE